MSICLVGTSISHLFIMFWKCPIRVEHGRFVQTSMFFCLDRRWVKRKTVLSFLSLSEGFGCWQAGYAASRSHIASNAIKTNCPMAECIRIAQLQRNCLGAHQVT